eukprot:92457-Chlamydomonas_euryale.AAC.1
MVAVRMAAAPSSRPQAEVAGYGGRQLVAGNWLPTAGLSQLVDDSWKSTAGCQQLRALVGRQPRCSCLLTPVVEVHRQRAVRLPRAGRVHPELGVHPEL